MLQRAGDLLVIEAVAAVLVKELKAARTHHSTATTEVTRRQDTCRTKAAPSHTWQQP